MGSLWWDRTTGQGAEDRSDPLPEDAHLDDLVVGAGLTGLAAALLLARAGRRVGVVEARSAGAVTTGHSTAKLSLLQGTQLSSILRHQPHSVAAAYVEGNREAQQWLLRFCETHGVAVQSRSAATYAGSPQQRRRVRREHRAAASLGLDVRWTEDLDVPFPVHGATVLADQAQFDPMDVVRALVDQLRAHGGTLHQGRRVERAAQLAGAPLVHLDDGTVLTADHVVLATGVPTLDRGLFFAKAEPQRSYGLALRGVVPPEGMYLSAGTSSRSVRDAPDRGDGPLLVVGGAGHTVGRARSEAAHLDELRHWTAEHFPGAVETHAWSAQDYSLYDGVPFVGRLPRGGGRVFAATGYAKWGMTNAVAAALTIAGDILGSRPRWSVPLERRALRPGSALQAARINAGVGLAAGVGFANAEARRAPERTEEGTGRVGRRLGVPVGVSEVEGARCSVLAVCTHLGGALKWNDAERSWDCPLHGSRFAPAGGVLEGPATRPLRRA